MQKQLELLKKYEISVRGIRGQHFLIDPNIQRKIIALIDPKPNERILEIGPGLGALTDYLCRSGANVTAIEKDLRFCEILKSEYGYDHKNLTVIHSDILSFRLAQLFSKKESARPNKFKVAGNIPYYITAPILFYLISNRQLIDSAVLMVQKEIMTRLLAQPGSKDYGRLTILARFYGDIEYGFDVSPGCFSPKPRVNSSVFKLTFHEKSPGVDETLFFEIVKHAFGERRKNILNALFNGFQERRTKPQVDALLKKAGIEPTKRAEELLLKDFLNLAEAFQQEAAEQV